MKDIFKTVEGIIVLAGFGAIILTGAKLFAWLGLIGYTIVNLKNGTEIALKILIKIKDALVALYKKIISKVEQQ